MSFTWNLGPYGDLAARARTGRRGDTPLPREAVRGHAAPRPTPDSIFKRDQPLPAFDLPTFQAAGARAGQAQRKRTAKYSMLIEGKSPQDIAADAANSPPARLARKRLGSEPVIAY